MTEILAARRKSTMQERGETVQVTSQDYSPDRPIISSDADRFDRWPFAKQIAETIARRVDPGSLVVGVYGEWGEGKTSALNLIVQGLGEHPEIIPVSFNPWYFGTEVELIRGFFHTLAEKLGKSLTTQKEDIGTLLRKYGSLLSIASLSIGGIVSISAGKAAQGLGEALSTVELDELRDRLGRLLKAEGKRVVVLVDDIDRLDRQEIQAIFKLVKLSANLDYTSYILAFDDATVAEALGEKYGSGDNEAGRRFLEKIVQVPLYLPPARDEALRLLVVEGINAGLRAADMDLSERDGMTFMRQFEDGLAAALRTPRQAILYGNAVAFALPLLKGEVDPVEQLLVEGMRVFYPKLYRSVRENPDIVLGSGYEGSRSEESHRRLKVLLQEAVEGLAPPLQTGARELVSCLFPRTRAAFGGSSFGSDWDARWEEEKRVCSERYFPRYFQYAVPSGDVPDATIDRFLAETVGAEEAAIAAAFRRLLGDRSRTTVIRKIHQRIESVDSARAGWLALALARCGDALPQEMTPVFLSTQEAAARLVAGLVARVPRGEARENLARRVVAEATGVSFALECVRWLCVPDREPEVERVIPTEVEEEVKRALATRVRLAAAKQPPYIEFPEVGAILLWTWWEYGSSEEVREYLKEQFSRNPEEAVRFLMATVPTSWGLGSGIRSKGDLDYGAYDRIRRLVDPEGVIAALRRIYGDAIDQAEYHPSRDLPPEQRIALQFVWVHRQRTARDGVGTDEGGGGAR